ncbi:acyl carrier protein [Prosthecobacter fusiformis]|uniref:Acyl carrier protein n=1 Tax=Prosthecobacter fusiformis TaxID=48464 RepID=A0A4R7RWK1_9BACT|nr:phosphopantetheine-binding protein [Prosthecobacter fusiformis]TDU69235.1 acyl carrier protein [Prosthecobacter fusiformis]
MNDTLTSVVAILRESLPDIEIDPATDGDRSLKELGIDSLDKMSVLLAVQDRWNLTFTEEQIGQMSTIKSICEQITA